MMSLINICIKISSSSQGNQILNSMKTVPRQKTIAIKLKKNAFCRTFAAFLFIYFLGPKEYCVEAI